ncbi:MAG: glycosyltransferase family 4 protein, partial [Actinobacteria bacterium]|nr:glycosyltransferase family 4 protein [Actinomycetota bacterium]
TNDFPPKVGGIQSYLWELWRRLPPESTTVLCTPHRGAEAFDAASPIRIERTRDPVLLPHPGLIRRIDALAAEVDADLVVLDPVLPIGAVGPRLERPYGLVVHGAEITLPGRLPGSRQLMGSILRGADLVIAAGGYPLAEAERCAGRPLPSVVIPPGVDTDRFVPLSDAERDAARRRFGLPPDATLVSCVSRLVPRKGFDMVIRAAARIAPGRPDLYVAIAGAGRDEARLKKLATELGAPVAFMGRLADEDLAAFHGCADVFAMLCHDRWMGLEQEGFGIVFLEAAACGVPQLAGRSGGSHEAVADGLSGVIVDHPRDVVAVSQALAQLVDRPDRSDLGTAARQRAVAEFSYDLLAERLAEALGCAADREVAAP